MSQSNEVRPPRRPNIGRPFLSTARYAVQLVRSGAPGPMRRVIAGQVLQAAALAVLLLAGRQVVAAMSQGADAIDPVGTVGWIALVGAGFALHGIAASVTTEGRRLVSEYTSRHVHRKLIEVTTTIDYQQFEVPDFHDRLSRAQSQVTQAIYGLVYGMIAISESLLSLVVVGLVLLRTMPELLIGLAIVGAPLVVVALGAARLSYRVSYELTTDDRRRNYLHQTMVGVHAAKEIRLFGLATPFTIRWDTLYQDRIDRFHRLSSRRIRLAAIGNVLAAAVAMGAMSLIVLQARWGTISTADTAVAALGFQQTVSRVRAMTNGIGSMRLNAFILDDFDHLMGLHPRATGELPVPDEPPTLRNLTFTDVGFVYPGTSTRALTDINLEVRPGRVTALVGANGSGKSTLAKLICGLYEPTDGHIAWNGDLVSARTLTASVAAIHQDFVRYELSAQENIAISRLDRNDRSPAELAQAIDSAVEMAGASAILAELPHGSSTVLSRAYDGGAELSGGQWQRLAIARALFQDAPIMVLDEPMSALDAHAEHDLFATLRTSFEDRAVILISHRFGAVRNADEICVLDRGRIVERGDHASLMAADRRYAALFRAQAESIGSLPENPPPMAARSIADRRHSNPDTPWDGRR